MSTSISMQYNHSSLHTETDIMHTPKLNQTNQLSSSLWALTGREPLYYRSWFLGNPRTKRPLTERQHQRCMQYHECVLLTGSSGSSSKRGSGSEDPDDPLFCRLLKEHKDFVCPSKAESKAGEGFGASGRFPEDLLGWGKLLPESGVVVLNSGAHHKDFTAAEEAELARGVADFVAQRFTGLVVWMKTISYVWECEVLDGPNGGGTVVGKSRKKKKKKKDMSGLIGSWDKINKIKAMGVWEQAFREAAVRTRERTGKSFDFVVLDTAMSDLRADQVRVTW